MALEAMDALIKAQPIDPDRIYVTGQSMAGGDTYNAKYYRPGLFAAAIPVCGIADPKDKNTIMRMANHAFLNDNISRSGEHESYPELAKKYKEERFEPIRTEYNGGKGTYASQATWTWLFQQQQQKKRIE